AVDGNCRTEETMKVLFLGSKMLGLSCLRRLTELRPGTITDIVTCDDRKDSRSVLGDFKSFARTSGIPLSIAASRRQAEGLISEIRPDLCVVVGWYWMIGPEALRTVPRGFL